MGLWIETMISIFLLFVIASVYRWVCKKPTKSIKARHIIVTGGSSGIGLNIAIECAKAGAHVTVIARNVKNLESTVEQIITHRANSDQKIQYRSMDLSKSNDVVEKCFAELEEAIAPIYGLINCAGMAICGTVDEMSIEDARHLMDVNYYATLYPTRYVLRQLKKTGDGIITITGSQASLVGIYGYGSYAAAKFALRGLAETIAMEVSHTKISITLALPADTDTPGFANENKTKPEETKIISGGGGLAKPETIAKRIFADILAENFISINGVESWLLTLTCAGLSPWGGIGFTLVQAVIAAPLRLIAFGLQYHFRSVVKKCANEKQRVGAN